MTAADFRKIALSLPETEERQHMNHPDFRVAGKIFATLGYPDKVVLGKIVLVFGLELDHAAVQGTWGKRGATSVHLKAAKKDTLTKAIQAAWRNTAPKRLLET